MKASPSQSTLRKSFTVGCLFLAFCYPSLTAKDLFEYGPINYSASTPKNTVSKLSTHLDGKDFKSQKDFLLAVLKVLDVPVESQVLVFTKTSAQKRHINEKSPRAIYYSNSIYVGYVLGGEIEIIAHDDKLGLVFYTISRSYKTKKLTVVRQQSCLSCHVSSRTQDIPGVFLRSLTSFTNKDGSVASDSFDINDSSPYAQRWGGWYVTGYWGKVGHQGNGVAAINAKALTKLKDLESLIDVESYPVKTSDVAALAVLEHQCNFHNTLVAAKFNYDRSWYLLQALNKKALPMDKTTSSYRIASDYAKKITETLLFVNEAPIPEQGFDGGEEFQKMFEARGNNSSTSVKESSKNLRKLRLYKRVFKYRCSYMIYSPAFKSLPPVIKQLVFEQLRLALTEAPNAVSTKHLSKKERRSIIAILESTTEYKSIK